MQYFSHVTLWAAFSWMHKKWSARDLSSLEMSVFQCGNLDVWEPTASTPKWKYEEITFNEHLVCARGFSWHHLNGPPNRPVKQELVISMWAIRKRRHRESLAQGHTHSRYWDVIHIYGAPSMNLGIKHVWLVSRWNLQLTEGCVVAALSLERGSWSWE